MNNPIALSYFTVIPFGVYTVSSGPGDFPEGLLRARTRKHSAVVKGLGS